MIGMDNIIVVSEEARLNTIEFATKLAAAMGSTAAATRLELNKEETETDKGETNENT
jgi:ketol-acid reductoisomerase